ISASSSRWCESPRYRLHDLGGRELDRDHDRMLVGAGLLERLELALQERRGHVLVPARREARGDHFVAALQVDEPHAHAIADEHIPVSALERRARDHTGLT